MNPLVSSQLNRAIHHGADKGKFVLPKGEPPFIAESFILFFTRFHIGPSGKVKLAPRRHTEAAKEVCCAGLLLTISRRFTLTKHSSEERKASFKTLHCRQRKSRHPNQGSY